MHLCTKHLHAGLCESRARMTVQICVEGCRVPQGNCDRWHECFRKVEGILTSSTCRENHAGAKRAESSPVGDRLLLFTKETPLLERSHPCFFLSSVWRRHLFCPRQALSSGLRTQTAATLRESQQGSQSKPLRPEAQDWQRAAFSTSWAVSFLTDFLISLMLELCYKSHLLYWVFLGEWVCKIWGKQEKGDLLLI